MAAASGTLPQDEQDMDGRPASSGEEVDDATGAASHDAPGAASQAELVFALRMAAEAMRSTMMIKENCMRERPISRIAVAYCQ